MPTAQRPPALRSGFAWALAGNVVYAASQWAVLSLIAKLGSADMLGEYAFAMSFALPPSMLAHLNLRAVLATDARALHPFGDYLVVRLAVTTLSLVPIALVAAFTAYTLPIILFAIVLALEAVSDLLYGAMQRRERLDQVARSMIARGVISTAAVAVTLAVTRQLIPAMMALVLARLTVLFAYDLPRGSTGEDLAPGSLRSQGEILRTALPLGASLMLISLTSNVPRYAIEHNLGSRELGVFAAAASFITVGSTVANALGQSATARLARFFSSRDLPSFRRLAWQLTALALALGLAGIAAAAVAGPWLLRVVYRPEFASYAPLLVALMASGLFTYVAITLGYVLTSTRVFFAQMPLLAVGTAVSGGVSWLLVPQIGAEGSALALALAAAVQIGGVLWLLRRTLASEQPA